MELTPHHLFLFKLINNLNEVDEYASEIGYKTECNGDLVFNPTKILSVVSS